jgi:hypothetical protein
MTRPIPFSIGIGLIYAASVFPVLAPLPPSLSGQALAFLVFVRNFGNVLGITIGASSPVIPNKEYRRDAIMLGSIILTNELSKSLPEGFLEQVPGSVAGAYSAIPLVANL